MGNNKGKGKRHTSEIVNPLRFSLTIFFHYIFRKTCAHETRINENMLNAQLVGASYFKITFQISHFYLYHTVFWEYNQEECQRPGFSNRKPGAEPPGGKSLYLHRLTKYWACLLSLSLLTVGWKLLGLLHRIFWKLEQFLWMTHIRRSYAGKL